MTGVADAVGTAFGNANPFDVAAAGCVATGCVAAGAAAGCVVEVGLAAAIRSKLRV